MNNHNIPASVRKVKVEALKRLLVFTVACTCVSVMYIQWTYIWMLRSEMAEITRLLRPLDTAVKEGGICCDSAVCYGVDDHDTTVLSWAVGQSRGEGLQVSADTVTVETEGTYFIYSQILKDAWGDSDEPECSDSERTEFSRNPFLLLSSLDSVCSAEEHLMSQVVLYKDTTWVMGHVITKRHKGAETKLMKCLKSMPSNVSQPLNTCYTAGIYFLESGSTLQLSVPRKSAELILTAHATFMGLFNI